MWINRTAGALLLILGTLSGFVLLAASVYRNFVPSTKAFVGLFLFGNIAGTVLFAIGAPKGSTEHVFKSVGAILLIIGLSSAVAIFLARLTILTQVNSHGLWALFLLCTSAGACAVLCAEAIETNFGSGTPKKP